MSYSRNFLVAFFLKIEKANRLLLIRRKSFYTFFKLIKVLFFVKYPIKMQVFGQLHNIRVQGHMHLFPGSQLHQAIIFGHHIEPTPKMNDFMFQQFGYQFFKNRHHRIFSRFGIF